MTNDCPLCNPVDERVIWRGKLVRVIDASDDDLPGFVRVIVKRHAAEMVDLTPEESAMVRKAVRLCELCMLETMHPDKINLASLGNMVPHVHWHVIARYKDDAFFPSGHHAAVPVLKRYSKSAAPKQRPCLKSFRLC